ncbi:MAG: GNAT family N-acetyltransferase [Phycisphaerales bacterium JB037]
MHPFLVQTPRLRLRLPVIDDAAAMFAVYGDPEVLRYIPADPSPSLDHTRERLAERIAQQPMLGEHPLELLAIERAHDGLVVGCCGLVPVERKGPEVEIAYHIGRAHWGRGYATEAARACLAWGMGENGPGLDRVIGLIDPANEGSRRVLTKCGMRSLGETDRYYGMAAELFEIRRANTREGPI